ncbi:MAG: endolytic transglycosylase MltG [Acidobacteriaceae bacterium]|nr:endolytic transglycosylase MltG [Acidobacteriaceae bacterium]MBV8569074.1 endolytic transglycosylase MltG [Acidobacteriaceae bacterium]
MGKRGGLSRPVLISLQILLAAALALAVTLGGYWYFGPYEGFSTETFVEIQHGTSTRKIARQLAHQGVVRSEWAFLAVRLLHPRAPLQAGEYRFGSAETPWRVFNKIRRGEVFYEDFTVPEGSNLFDIAALLERTDLVRPAAFLKAAADTSGIHDLDPSAPDLEGYLFPSTYRLTHRTTAKQLCLMMTAEFRKQFASFSPSPQTNVHEIVTLASMVEKESAIAQERPVIASVFLNRLKLNMPLQCDPTTVYAALLENRYRGVIHKSDLASANPYNTYTHAGLPPGPIANPGSGALQAVLRPADTNYVYFVAKPDGSGSHVFSATLTEHEKAVLAYRNGAH